MRETAEKIIEYSELLNKKVFSLMELCNEHNSTILEIKKMLSENVELKIKHKLKQIIELTTSEDSYGVYGMDTYLGTMDELVNEAYKIFNQN